MSSEEKFKKKFDASRALSNSDLGRDRQWRCHNWYSRIGYKAGVQRTAMQRWLE